MQEIICVCCGGDGSLMTTLTYAKQAGVELNGLICVALPYGTGNDLARTTGWGGAANAKYLSTLK